MSKASLPPSPPPSLVPTIVVSRDKSVAAHAVDVAEVVFVTAAHGRPRRVKVVMLPINTFKTRLHASITPFTTLQVGPICQFIQVIIKVQLNAPFASIVAKLPKPTQQNHPEKTLHGVIYMVLHR